MAVKVKVYLNLPKAVQIVEKAGLGRDGAVQEHWTKAIVLRRMAKFMPFVSGAFKETTIANTTSTEIVSVGPHAGFLYFGKVMVGDESNSPWAREGETKHAVDDWDIDYNQERNSQAGAFWDRAVVANDGKAMVRDLQAFINKR